MLMIFVYVEDISAAQSYKPFSVSLIFELRDTWNSVRLR